MATTPPPPARIHTPPTPRHGSKYDSYEPYSPRRSSRVAAQRKHIAIPENFDAPLFSPKQRRIRAVTPTNVPQGVTRTSSQTFSPPSSPSSAFPGTPMTKGKGRATQMSRLFADAEPAEEAGGPAFLDPRAMLPTPSKTPRKRAFQTQASISSTARVLFPGRTATIEDAMPDPRKSRRAKNNAFSLASFEAMANAEDSSKIPIYTDTKERVPDLDEDEDNPFVIKRGSTSRSPRSTRKPRKDGKAVQMEHAMRNDEGVIVTFRGKKIFKKFEDEEPQDETAEEDTWSDLEIRRKAGNSSRERPFLRSTYKPRLLFPTDEQRHTREHDADEADEEALTDIEVPIPQSSKHQKSPAAASTPVRKSFREMTPPTTVRKTRGTVKRAPDFILPASMEVDRAEEEHDLDDQVSVTSSKKNSPFDTWRRTKSGAKPVFSKKREAAPMEAEGSASKRARGISS